ncbi:MAG: T9SS type A sorting domain-containing protein, partial [Bacteroidota bacterium]
GQGEGEPLLQVNVTGGVVVSVVYKGENILGLPVATKNDFEFVLYPNPPAEQITAKYSLPKNNDVVFSLVDEKGSSVLLIEKKNELSGDHVLNFDLPSNLAAGNYFLKMTSGNSSVTKPLSIQ